MKKVTMNIVNKMANAAVGILVAEGIDSIMSRAHKALAATAMKRECTDRAYVKLMNAYDSVKRRYEFVAQLAERAPRISMDAAEAMQSMIDMKDLFDTDLHSIKCGIVRYADNGKMTGTQVGNLEHLINRLKRFSAAVAKAEELVTTAIKEAGFRSHSEWLTRDVDNVEFAMSKNIADLREDNFLGKC